MSINNNRTMSINNDSLWDSSFHKGLPEIYNTTYGQPMSVPIVTSGQVAREEIPKCGGCHKQITGPTVKALNKYWHPEHFVCSHCKKQIRKDKFSVHDNMIFCEKDYSRLFLKRCKACNLPITDVVVVALNSNWHREHFVCFECHTPLSTHGFIEQDNRAFCVQCFQNLFSPICKACGEYITDGGVSAMNSKWHPSCFVCKDCSSMISASPFHVEDEKPICQKCMPIELSDKTV